MNFLALKPGQSVEGAKIEAYRSEYHGDKYFYLMAGVHGDEVEGIYCLKQLFTWLETQELEIPMIVIPVLNVDGHKNGTRTNSQGVDLNRNLPSTSWTSEVTEEKYHPGTAPLSGPENQYFDQLMKKYPPYFILTLHSWKPMINYNGDCLKAAEFISQFNKYPIADDIGYPTPGSLGDYGPEKYGAPVITYELPVLSEENSLKSIWEENEEALKNFLKSNFVKK